MINVIAKLTFANVFLMVIGDTCWQFVPNVSRPATRKISFAKSIKSCKIAHLCLVTQQVNHLDCQCNTVDVLLLMVSLYLRDI